ncbi:MAG: M20/M25/M40 family metallo-hydrolase [Acidobacteria bacterium]|nr:M20/M25/M40 family metallo-hydrolase [Acidobacteriota bacterium]
MPLRAAIHEEGPVAAVEVAADDPRVVRALDWLGNSGDWITTQHIRITEVPAPPFQEKSRALLVRKLLEGLGLKLRIDEIGNVIGERPGTDTRNVVILSAHLDTVFPAGTDVQVRREPPVAAGRIPQRLNAPGITDNSSGLAALVAVARAMHEGKLRTKYTIVFTANVGEEGEGNLRGIRKLMETYKGRVRAVIAIDGASVEHVTTMALGSKRFEVTITGPGGHSWSDFGLPNPIHALSRGISRFVRVKVPGEPRTTFNVGEVQGGTSVNSIPASASIKVDMRSTSTAEIEKLESALRDAIAAGVDEENAAARERGMLRKSTGKLEAKLKLIGERPAGGLPENSFLMDVVREVDKQLNQRSRPERSSTDANIPLSQGLPAISIGAGGRGGGAHSLAEWYDPEGREAGLKRVFLLLTTTAGVEKTSVRASAST